MPINPNVLKRYAQGDQQDVCARGIDILDRANQPLKPVTCTYDLNARDLTAQILRRSRGCARFSTQHVDLKAFLRGHFHQAWAKISPIQIFGERRAREF